MGFDQGIPPGVVSSALVGSTLPIAGAVPLKNFNRQAAGANAASSAIITPAAGHFAWITAFMVWCGYATTAGVLTCTLTGLPVSIDNFDLNGTTTTGDRILYTFPQPIQGNTVGVGITVTVPASGGTGPAIGCMIQGFQL